MVWGALVNGAWKRVSGTMAASGGSDTAPIVRNVKRTGGVIAVVGGLLAALAYWVMPVATIPLVGSVTAPALIEEASDAASLGLLRIVPVTVILTILLGFWLLLARPSGRFRPVAAVVVLLCSLLTVVAYLIPLGRIDNAITSSGAAELGIRATTFTGAGFWLAIIGAVVAAIGAIVELSSLRARA